MEKVLVTGATGFIGLHCIDQLLNQGYAVNGSLRSPERKIEILNALKNKNTPTEKLNLFNKKYLVSINQSYCHIKSLRFLLNLHAKSNRISFENQLLLAQKSKLKASKKSSAVEHFMRVFFLHAAKLSDFNEMVFRA